MVVTTNVTLPTEEELTVPEVNVTGATLQAASFYMGKHCEYQNNEFMLCRQELKDPRKCINEGKAVTGCALDFFRRVKKLCHSEFVQYANCLDKSSGGFEFDHCRKTQAVLDSCIKDNMGIERPEYGYYCRAKVHDTKRPKPNDPGPIVYEDATPELPDNAERPPAKYGSRFHFLN